MLLLAVDRAGQISSFCDATLSFPSRPKASLRLSFSIREGDPPRGVPSEDLGIQHV